MSGKLKKHSVRPRKHRKRAIDRPFDREVIRQAEQLAGQYRLVVEQEAEEGGYGATVLEMPNIYGWGKTIEECIHQTRELLVTALAYMIEQGEEPPAGASENKRTEQVNVRLTPMEKLKLEEAAQQEGFRGVSDYVRSASMRSIKSERQSRRATGRRRVRSRQSA